MRGVVVSAFLIAAPCFAACGGSDPPPAVENACGAAMAKAAAVVDVASRVTDVDPAVLACTSVAEFANAALANPGAIDVDALTWLTNRCADPSAPEVQASAVCVEVAALTTTTASTTTVAATTTTVEPAPTADELIAACIEYIPIGAFIGDETATNMWNFIQQDLTAVPGLCEQLQEDDPDLVATFAEALERYEAATEASPSATTARPATTAPVTTAAPTTAPATTARPTTVAPDDDPPTAGGGTGNGMPNVVCMNLQDAQDLIQARTGVFLSRSVDATGEGRSQIVDSNWLVVAQDPAPGTPIGEGDAVLAVVKYGETSDC